MKLLVVVVVVALTLGACANEAFIDEVERAPNNEILKAGRLGTTQLVDGDCFSERPGSAVRSVDAVPCGEPHRGQVLGRVSSEQSDTWPGVESLTAEAGPLCMRLAGDLLAPHLSENMGLPMFGLSAYIPDESAWDDGDRSIVCWAEAVEPITIDLRTVIPA